MEQSDTARQTALHALNASLGAKFVVFAGYDMPVQYSAGVMGEHLQTRNSAGLFDVSHMGQIRISGPDAAAQLEMLVPGDIQNLPVGRTRYTLLLNQAGGINDDLMVTNRGDHLFLVVNAGTKEADFAQLQQALAGKANVEFLGDRALLAVQGPLAASVVAALAPDLADLSFMAAASSEIGGIPVIATRSGYTGEDGYEISVAYDQAEDLARLLLKDERLAPIGLGARDSLRLEAGLCLYGHDIDQQTTPIEAGLAWTLGKRRREEANFPGAAIILDQLKNGAARKRVGILPDGKAPAREHTPIEIGGRVVGEITSGGFGPTLGGPIAMGYVETAQSAIGTKLDLIVRGTPRAAQIVALPFVPHRYHR